MLCNYRIGKKKKKKKRKFHNEETKSNKLQNTKHYVLIKNKHNVNDNVMYGHILAKIQSFYSEVAFPAQQVV